MELCFCMEKVMIEASTDEDREYKYWIREEDGMGEEKSIIAICLKDKRKNPLEILELLMSQDFCPMHGPVHHILVGASLLTAYKNAGGDIDLPKALEEMCSRGKSVPGGVCGLWGACGAGISTGMYVSILTEAAPLAKKPWSLSNQMTSRALKKISEYGGPRCCKRDSYLAVIEAIKFTKEYFDIEMEKSEIVCTRSHQNNQCLERACLFHP